MKTILVTSLSLALFSTSTPLAQRREPVIVKSRRSALVIGNAAYKESPLSNPVNDAKDISQLLSELGFEVIYKQNASRAEMKSAIREFGNNIVKGDVALFYFAGHGAQVNGENYLIPVDAVITKEEEVEYESVNAGLVLAQMASAATANVSSIELKFWESIEKSSDPKDFEAYLKKYPNGNFVDLANNRVKSLESAKGGAQPNTAGGAPNSSPPNSSSRDEQPQMLAFRLKHDIQLGDDHDGTLSISPQQIKWEESGLFSDQRDNFSISCSQVSSLLVALRKSLINDPHNIDLINPDLANREYIAFELSDKRLNQKGRKSYSFLAITESDRRTINEVGEVIQRACPGAKIKAYRR
jgi:caspase domain-containing protein